MTMSRTNPRDLYRVTVLGDGGVGKTALTIQVNTPDADSPSVSSQQVSYTNLDLSYA